MWTNQTHYWPHPLALLAVALGSVLTLGCGSGGSSAPVPTLPAAATPLPPAIVAGPLTFTTVPIDWLPFTLVSQIGVAPQGAIGWRVQFFGLTSVGRNVYAPADGIVTEIGYEPTDVNLIRPWIDFQGGGAAIFRLDSLATTLVSVGDHVRSGQVVGTRPKDDRGRDMGIYLSVRLPRPTFLFLRPDRYRHELVYAADPIPFFAEPLRSEIETRAGMPTLRQLSFDEPGSLHGRWYLEGLEPSKTFNVLNAADRLAFFDTRLPSGEVILKATYPHAQERLSNLGVPILTDGTPHPRAVRPGHGAIRYQMEPRAPGSVYDILLVELLGDGDRIMVETFNTYTTPNPSGFTDKARVFTR